MGRVLPILFNGDMVRAIPDGRKTVTRRVIKPHNVRRAKDNGYFQGNGLWVDPSVDNGDHEGHIKDYSISPCWISWNYYIQKYAPCQPGDILYVRETWQYIAFAGENNGYVYKASDNGQLWEAETENWKWRPSIHMPREAARIWLKVTDVCVEHLQDITEEQVKAEGITEEWAMDWWRPTYNDPDSGGYPRYIDTFADLWDFTIQKPVLFRYGWKANPWVWRIEFEPCEKPVPCILAGVQPAEDKYLCIGYGKSEIDDEPCEMCKHCSKCTGN